MPTSYDKNVAAPLIVLLHGGGNRSSSEWESPALAQLADSLGAVVLLPDSRFATWDIPQIGEFAEDVVFLDAALRETFELCRIHPSRIIIGGFSDGATQALSVGVANGDLFDGVVAFSPGFMDTRYAHGLPRVFVSHGKDDKILPFISTKNALVPYLENKGHAVTFVEFDGGHTIPAAVGEQAFAWMGAPWK